MNVTCSNGHSQTIMDPTDAGWEYSTRDELRVDSATFPDGSTQQVQRTVAVAFERRIVWKCGAPAPTDENPAALCGSVEVITESVALPAGDTDGDN